MDSKLVDVLLESSRQLNTNVSELTTAVHELTVSTRLQQQSTDALVDRMGSIEAWRVGVDKHMLTMSPVTGVVLGLRKVVVVAVVTGLAGLIGYQLIAVKDGAPQKETAQVGRRLTVEEK